ncbi:hypothetical protein [Faecalispora anaeroviscerum]|uniref:hypothetical protein n=1 Tax=Faecalispora anaeroviscerum TaxID=2991836 RepID=UPI0024B94A03|nr:hypothetical protein [Faecalispora anaeroviscerum]
MRTDYFPALLFLSVILLIVLVSGAAVYVEYKIEQHKQRQTRRNQYSKETRAAIRTFELTRDRVGSELTESEFQAAVQQLLHDYHLGTRSGGLQFAQYNAYQLSVMLGDIITKQRSDQRWNKIFETKEKSA